MRPGPASHTTGAMFRSMYWPPRSAGGLPADGYNVNPREVISATITRRFLRRSREHRVNPEPQAPKRRCLPA